MRNIVKAMAFAALLSLTGTARAADSWGLPREEIVRFDAKVVDILCELTGDCVDNCGGGKRQLGLLTDEGALVLPIKNFTPFSGTVDELLEFCGERVTADGLFSTNRGYKVFALQFVKGGPDGKWRRANRFLPKWAETNGFNPKGKEAKEWFRNDPRINAVIAEDGVLGLGPEADEAYRRSQE